MIRLYRPAATLVAVTVTVSVVTAFDGAATRNDPPTSVALLPSTPGLQHCEAWDISDGGVIVGYCDAIPVRWTPTGGSSDGWQFEALAGPLGIVSDDGSVQEIPVDSAMAVAISPGGTIAGDVRVTFGQPRLIAATWSDRDGIWQAFPGALASNARDITNQGRVIGRWRPSGIGTYATVWDGASVELLPHPADSIACQGYAGNERGDVVGTCTLGLGTSVASIPVLWNDGIAIELSSQRTTGDLISNFARAINSSGLVGGSADGQAVLWHANNPNEVTVVAALGSINGVSDNQQLVGYVGINGAQDANAPRATWWASATGAPVFLFPAGEQSFARAINHRGEVVGHVFLPDGTVKAFVAR